MVCERNLQLHSDRVLKAIVSTRTSLDFLFYLKIYQYCMDFMEGNIRMFKTKSFMIGGVFFILRKFVDINCGGLD